MPRTDADAVKAVLLEAYDGVNLPDLATFIGGAELIVDRVETVASDADTPLTDEELERIECYVAAHLYVQSDQNYRSSSIDRSSGSFQGNTGMYLEGSKFGQVAMLMDYSGALSKINSTPVLAHAQAGQGQGRDVGGIWLG